jgi:transposase
MRASDPPVQYLVGTPKGRLTELEAGLLLLPWSTVREGVQTKLLPAESGEVYVLAESSGRVKKERAMRRRKLRRLVTRLKELQRQAPRRDKLLMALGAAKADAGRLYGVMSITLPGPRQKVNAHTFHFRLDRAKLRAVRRREGRYLLRSNLTGRDPGELWNMYMQLVQIEEAFKNLKGDLALRPVYHQKMERIEAHIFVAFIAYTLHVCLRQHCRALAGGLTARAVLEKFSAVQMIDVHLPCTDGRTVILSRYTQPEKELLILLQKLHLQLPAQPPPRISNDDVVKTLA